MADFEAADARALVARLRPMDTDLPLLRLGAEKDGGYLVPDDLDGIAACFSPGVSHTATFEAALHERGVPSFLADASVDGPPRMLPDASFIKKFLGPKTENEFVALDDWVRENAPATGDLLLQMDIEGAEYATVAAASPDTLRRFRIVVVEVHQLHWWATAEGYRKAREFLDPLLDGFTVVHLHPNNCCGMVKLAGIEVPRLVEITFLRNDRVRNPRPASVFPHPLDRRNVVRKDDIVLPRTLWADDSPLFLGTGGTGAGGGPGRTVAAAANTGAEHGGAAGQPVHQGVRDRARDGPVPGLHADAGRDRPVGNDDTGRARGRAARAGATRGRAGRGAVKSGQRRHVSTGSPFEAAIGYARAVVCDGWVFVSGTTGYDYATMRMPESIDDQCRNAIGTIAAALGEAGGSLDDVVRVRYIVPDPAEWPRCWPIVAEAFGTARPAATMIAAALQDPAMRIEIEVTARLKGVTPSS